MTTSNLLVECRDQVAHITINRPDAMNALNPATADELKRTIKELENSVEAKAVVITGQGPKAFCAGGDVALMRTLGPIEARKVALGVAELFHTIESSPLVVIAAVNGYALGGGCELAMACDLRLAAEKAQLGQPEINLGILPGWGGTQRLPRLIGVSRAKKLIFTGERITAQQAMEFGLVDEVLPGDELLEAAHALAVTIAGKPQSAIRMIKQSIYHGMQMDLDRAIQYEAELFGMCFATKDKQEGMDAFFEKRPPKWQDC
ncbi:enoyl-CoA hydratase-related protein [uncultured Desulfuromonas sp.]|uniref:enoyl-CoA hydratase/isomerase family protein n=1 Tax=uncultured Desulfuromonas sp. TaxID=181013 RepID=UPI002AAADE15|nr:enoyl-CoA hydratase-related protein [uncultured Desulfuromonas sp.]